MITSQTKTMKCIHRDSCKYCDTIDCIDNPNGCLKYFFYKEEAENPIKSRR